MAALYVAFHSVTVKSDKAMEGEISFNLDGFDPDKGHTAQANLSGSTLTVTAKKGPSNYRKEITDLDISSAAAKPKKDKINVLVKKNSNFKLEEKINKK